uniref:Uncharacterized protein n=1 Tax=Mus musculus TaxID=10090 RepID=Q3U3Z1_MOUSE|nr:unnamed protein product [Mus musculus]
MVTPVLQTGSCYVVQLCTLDLPLVFHVLGSKVGATSGGPYGARGQRPCGFRTLQLRNGGTGTRKSNLGTRAIDMKAAYNFYPVLPHPPTEDETMDPVAGNAPASEN